MEQAVENTQGQADGAVQEESVAAPESGTQAAQESGAQEQAENSEFSIDSLPKEAQEIIKGLRGENAKYRTEKNNLSTRLENIENGFKTMFGGEGEGQESTPEEQIQQLQGGYESLSYENALMGMAYENGIPKENYEYFNFLMDKEVNGLEEGQELDEESLLGLIQKAKGFNQGGMDATNSSVNEGEGQAPNPEGGAALNLESFTKMTIAEKSELYRRKPEVYNSLMKQAKEKRLL